LLVAGLANCAFAQSGPSPIIIGTDPVGGISNPVGRGIAEIINRHSSVAASVQAFDGPAVWMPRLNEGTLQLGAHVSPTAWLSFNSIDTPVRLDRIRILRASAAVLPLGFMVRRDSDIKSVADLRGRRVAAVYRLEPVIRRVSEGTLALYGIGLSDVQIVPVDAVLDGVDALVEGRVDAAWFTAQAPRTREVDAKIGLRFLSVELTPEWLEKARRMIFPGVTGLTFSGDLPYLPKGTPLLSYEIYLLASTHTPDQVATSVLSALWQHDEELTRINATLHGFTNKAAVTATPVIPYHPAAIDFYRSMQAWTPAADTANQAISKR
jgi:TRAP transporter TAXI family solute receptor